MIRAGNPYYRPAACRATQMRIWQACIDEMANQLVQQAVDAAEGAAERLGVKSIDMLEMQVQAFSCAQARLAARIAKCRAG